MEIIKDTIIGTLIALIIWDLFLSTVCSRIRHNYWLNSKISKFYEKIVYEKISREFIHKLFRINRMKRRGRSPSFSEFVDSYSQSNFGNRPLNNINIKIQGKKRVFKKVRDIKVAPTGYESVKYTLNITTLDSNGVDEKTISLEISREEKKKLAKKMYGAFVLYHKKW